MRAFHNLSIQRKLTLIIMLTSSVALLLAAAVYGIYDLLKLRRSMAQDLAVLGEIIGSNSRAALVFNDPNSAEETLAAMAAEGHVVAAILYTKDGKVFAQYLRSDSREHFTPPPVQQWRTAFENDYLFLFRPIMHEDEEIGTIYLQSDMREFYSRLKQFVSIGGLVMLAVCCVAFLLASRLQKLISAPILHLTQTAWVISAEKNYSIRAVKHSSDELGFLIDRFNEMLARIQDRDKELSALLDVGATATQSLNIGTVLQRVAQKISAIFELDTTRIYLFEKAGKLLRLRAIAGDDRLNYQDVFQLGDGVLGRAAESREPLIIEDIQDDPRYNALSHSGTLSNAGYRFFAIFPIKAKGELLGAISCNSRQVRRLSSEETRLIESLADQLAPAIDNLNLFEELKEKTAELETKNTQLLESLAQQTAVAGTLRVMATSPSSLQAIFDSILADAARLTKATGGVIRLVDGAGVLRFVAHHGRSRQALAELQKLPSPDHENSASTSAMRDRRAVQIEDIQKEQAEWRPPVAPGPWHTALAIPLLQDNHAIGVIVLFRDTVERFTDRQVALLTTFADQAVIAIKSATLFQELQARTREIESANTRLTRLDKLKSGFLSNVSHELRTPLTAISSLVDNMLDGVTGVLNEKQARHAVGIKESSERLTRLINDLLDLSVIESGRVTVDPSRFSLSELVHQVAATMLPVAQGKSVAVEVPEIPGASMAWADRDRINQVLINLIGNAIKFTPEDGHVSIMIHPGENDDWLSISISDTGPGIPEEERTQIFDEFYQISRPGELKAKGVGLGLAISKKLVEMNGGTISVNSRPGGGSTFTFAVPAYKEGSTPTNFTEERTYESEYEHPGRRR